MKERNKLDETSFKIVDNIFSATTDWFYRIGKCFYNLLQYKIENNFIRKAAICLFFIWIPTIILLYCAFRVIEFIVLVLAIVIGLTLMVIASIIDKWNYKSQ